MLERSAGDGSGRALSQLELLDPRDLVQVKYEMVRRARVDGAPVARAAEAFGFSRPSFYAAAAALHEDGLAGLVPARPGPRRGHKLTEEIVAFAAARREVDPSLRAAELVEVIAERFGVRVHPRSVERALAAPRPPQKCRRSRAMRTLVVRPRSSAMSSCVPARCPAHRTGGGWGWRCSSAAGWPPGRGHGERPCRHRRHHPGRWSRCPRTLHRSSLCSRRWRLLARLRGERHPRSRRADTRNRHDKSQLALGCRV